MSVFAGLRPPLTATEVEVKFGPPARSYKEGASSTVYVWPQSNSEIQVVFYEEPWDGWTREPADWDGRNKHWLLYAAPIGKSPEELLHPSLHRFWEMLPPDGELILMHGLPDIRIWKGSTGQVARIRWHSPGGW